MQARQLITGLVLALAAFFIYQWVLSFVFPPRPLAPATQPAAGTPATGPAPSVPPSMPAISEPQPVGSAPATTAASNYVFAAGESQRPVSIGGGPDDALGLVLTPRGAGMESLFITQRRNGRYVYSASAGKDAPCEVLDVGQLEEAGPLGSVPASFSTAQIRVQEYDNHSWRLDNLIWNVAEVSERRAVFTTTLAASHTGEPLLRLTKTYELQGDQPFLRVGLTVHNADSRPLSVVVDHNGPATIRRESPMYDMRRVMTAHSDGQVVKLGKVAQRSELQKKAAAGEMLKLFGPGEGTFAWTALVNRFFGVFTRPLADGGSAAGAIQLVQATVLAPESTAKLGDLLARLTSAPLALEPGADGGQLFEVYVGPKDPDVLAEVNPAFVDSTKLNYSLAHAADGRCCTFEPLPQVMTTLLRSIRFVVRNYGIAIIILVVIVRICLHPLSVYQQKQMYRMQDSMSRLQPKLQDIKQRHANDKVRQNQETMKLYAEEGVNPMAGVIGMLPMFIQMPILVALWTALNTDIQLRHAPFDGWWIKDLAAPDALVPFSPPITIPILGQLPLLGWMFSGITAFNLLPLLMAVSMWLQQKYMPKPGMQAKLEAARKQPPAERKPGQMSPEDQLRQQQMMSYMMTIMMPLMFYYMPSGLNLYWMATNVFGIGESLIIRKQLEEEKRRRDREGPKPSAARKPGLVGRLMKRMAEQAEQIQRKADQLADRGKPRKDPDRDQKKR